MKSDIFLNNKKELKCAKVNFINLNTCIGSIWLEQKKSDLVAKVVDVALCE